MIADLVSVPYQMTLSAEFAIFLSLETRGRESANEVAAMIRSGISGTCETGIFRSASAIGSVNAASSKAVPGREISSMTRLQTDGSSLYFSTNRRFQPGRLSVRKSVRLLRLFAEDSNEPLAIVGWVP